jgi:hypothetical protein
VAWDNREQGTGNREQGTGNREQGTEKGEGCEWGQQGFSFTCGCVWWSCAVAGVFGLQRIGVVFTHPKMDCVVSTAVARTAAERPEVR